MASTRDITTAPEPNEQNRRSITELEGINAELLEALEELFELSGTHVSIPVRSKALKAIRKARGK